MKQTKCNINSLIHDCTMTGSILSDWVYHVFLIWWLTNFVYLLLLHGLSLCPALTNYYYCKGFWIGSVSPPLDLNHCPLFCKAFYPSFLSNNLHCPNSLIVWCWEELLLHLCSKRNLFKLLINIMYWHLYLISSTW